MERAHQTVADAERMDHSLTLSIVLIWAVSVFLWTGDLESAEEHIDRLISQSESHSLAPYLAVGRGFRGSWLFVGAVQQRGLRACRTVWRASAQCPMNCFLHR